MMRHETGHTYGLPHWEDGFRDHRYPFAKRTDGSGCVLGVPNEDGCGVGTAWKYFQYFGVVQSKDETKTFDSPFKAGSTTEYLRDPMAGGGDNWLGEYSVQAILDYMQDRVYWDDERAAYVKYDKTSGEFVVDTTVKDDGWYGRPAKRDVPVYTIFGSYSSTVPAVNVIQKPLHFRGHLPKVIDPSKDADLQWLQGHRGAVCGGGCDFVVRVTFAGNVVRTYLLKRGNGDFVRWAVNVPDEGAITKVELLKRPMKNGGSQADANDVSKASAATYFAGASVVATR
jgi:hypothetical protein